MTAKLKIIPSKRTQERESLAQAIADAAVVERRAFKACDSKERASALVAGAESKLSEATSAVEKARDAQSRRAFKAIKAGADIAPDATTRNARLNVADAEDAVEAAKAALASCEDAFAESEDDLRRAQQHVVAAADDVIRTEQAHRVLQQAQMLQEQLLRARVQRIPPPWAAFSKSGEV